MVLDEFAPVMMSKPVGLSTLSPPRLSIVVLPLANLSGAPEQDYFVDGVTGSLTTDLARINGSFVIGQHTDAHVMMGIAEFYRGCGAKTESHVNEALRLSPRDIFAFHRMCTAGFAKLQIAADAEAAAWFARGIEANRNFPDLHFGYAAALALLGKLDEAQVAARTGLEVDPSFTIRRVRNVPVRGDGKFVAGAKRFVKRLYIAGVPEG